MRGRRKQRSRYVKEITGIAYRVSSKVYLSLIGQLFSACYVRILTHLWLDDDSRTNENKSRGIVEHGPRTIRDATRIEKYVRLRALLVHYETDIMTRRGFRKRIPRKRYEVWSASTRYLGFDTEIKYAFSRRSSGQPLHTHTHAEHAPPRGRERKLFTRISWSFYRVFKNYRYASSVRLS